MKRYKEIMMSETVETNPIEDLINYSLNQDYNKANQIFGSVVGQKLDVALEQEKIRLADTIYNGIDPDEEEDDVEMDDDQLEFDLESEDNGGAEEGGATDDSETGEADSETESDPEEEI